MQVWTRIVTFVHYTHWCQEGGGLSVFIHFVDIFQDCVYFWRCLLSHDRTQLPSRQMQIADPPPEQCTTLHPHSAKNKPLVINLNFIYFAPVCWFDLLEQFHSHATYPLTGVHSKAVTELEHLGKHVFYRPLRHPRVSHSLEIFSLHSHMAHNCTVALFNLESPSW